MACRRIGEARRAARNAMVGHRLHGRLAYRNMSLDNIRIVLVATSHPGNIGAAARAMKTMGLSQLVLVNPLRYPDPQAEWRAAAATERAGRVPGLREPR